MEIDLVRAPASPTVIAPVKAMWKPLPTVQPLTRPVVRQCEESGVPLLKVHRVREVMQPKAVSFQKATSASKGALQAQPDKLSNEPPDYPEDARVAREQGVVMLRVRVTAGGEAATVSIQQSSGYLRLDQAALRAVRRWKFHPALAGDEAVASEVEVPVRFKLQ